MDVRYEEMGLVLYNLIRECGMNPAQFARQPEIQKNKSYISRLIGGEKPFTWEGINLFSDYFHVPVEKFLFSTDYEGKDMKLHDKIDPKTICGNFYKLRKERGLTCEEMADELYKTFNRVEGVVKDNHIPIEYFTHRPCKETVYLAVTERTICRWENFYHGKNPSNAIRLIYVNFLADILGVGAEELLF